MKLFKKIKKGDMEIDPQKMEIDRVYGYFDSDDEERVYGADTRALKQAIGNQGIYALYKQNLMAYNRVIEKNPELMNAEDWKAYDEIKRWCSYYSVKSGVDDVKKRVRTSEAVLKNIDLSLDNINFGRRKPP